MFSIGFFVEPIQSGCVSTGMRKLFTLTAFLIISVLATSQESFLVKGEIRLVSYYQGGMELPEEQRSPKPNPNISVTIIKYNGPDEYSTIVNTVTSNENGDFEIMLPEGSYGFVLPNQIKDLKKHRGLFSPISKPREKEKEFTGVGTNDSWVLNANQPFVVGGETNTKFIITHYYITTCYTCP